MTDKTIIIRKITPDELPSLLSPLAQLFKDSVEAGANVNFILPFPIEEAITYLDTSIFKDVAADARTLWIAEYDGEVAGSVQLITKLPPNQIHRCEVAKLLVHPNFRRRGIADLLLKSLLVEATRLGKSLITLDTVTDSPAQTLYANHGFKLGGVIPGFAREPDSDTLVPTSYMYREI